jgi:hypothetical protein
MHGDLIEQEACRRKHAGKGLAMGHGQGRNEAFDGGATAKRPPAHS